MTAEAHNAPAQKPGRITGALKRLLPPSPQEADADVKAILEELAEWEPDDDQSAAIRDETEACLQSVTHATEYQDEKASRVATAVSFLSAMAGAVYAATYSTFAAYTALVFCIFNVLFLLFSLAVLLGLGLMLYGIYPRFYLPSPEKRGTGKDLRSLRFPPLIVRVNPATWATAFSSRTQCALQLEAAKQNVIETYLIATKFVFKLRILKKAMLCFIAAPILFLIWAVFAGGALVISERIESSKILRGVLLLTDAGNVMWDLNSVYEKARLRMLTSLCEDTGMPIPSDSAQLMRQLDQKIASTHRLEFKYPPTLLAQSALSNLIAQSSMPTNYGQAIGMAAVSNAVVVYNETLDSPPPLKEGVKSTLAFAAGAGATIIVVSEDRRAKVMEWLTEYRLSEFISGVTTGRKTPELFRHIETSHPTVTRIIMVGDQPDRDIVPARSIGAITVLLDSGFKPYSQRPEDETLADYQAATYTDLRRILLREAQLGSE